jgi:DnaJ-class molecular chaperone
MGKKKLYETLQISENATPAEIKKAYYRLALILHPDKRSNSDKVGGFRGFAVANFEFLRLFGG